MCSWKVGSSKKEYVFESESLKLVWSIDPDTPGLKAITSKVGDYTFAVGAGSPLWEINVRDNGGYRHELKGSDLEHFSYEVGETLILNWLGLVDGQIDVKLTGTADPTRPMIKWRIEVTNRSDEYTIWEVTMPSLKDVVGPTGSHEDDRMLTSEGFGCSIPQPQKLHKHAVWERFQYPNNIVSMQYCALQNDKHGLYIGLHDPESLRKDFQYSPPAGIAATGSGNNDFVGAQPIKVTIPAPDSGKNQKTVSLDFDIVMALFEGDWYDAALLHREWTDTLPRTDVSVTDQPQIPEWAKKIPLWIRCNIGSQTKKHVSDEDYDKLFEELLAFRVMMGVEMGVHIYHWHNEAFDVIYPAYTPRKGFKEFVAKLQANGMHAMPYINGRLFDVDCQDWEIDQARKFATKEAGAKLDGKAERIIFETYGSKTPMAVMCPATEYWQDKISDVIVRLANDLGVDGVYSDQICAAWPELCADRSHGHQLRNGAWWNQGYYKMLEKVREKMAGKELLLTTESNADPFTHVLGMLMVNGHRNFIVPAFSAVYGSRALLFGRSEKVDNSAAFRIMTYQNVVWGCQPGWFSNREIDLLMSGDFELELETLKNATALFSQLEPYLHGGSMNRPPVNLKKSNKADIIWQFNGLWPENIDTIWTGAWQLGQSVMTAVANADKADQNVEIEYNYSEPEISVSDSKVKVELKDNKAYIFLPAGSCATLKS